MSAKPTPAGSPVFLVALLLLALAAAPIWIPLAMCASMATGRSLKGFNAEANRMSRFDGEEAP